MSGAGGLVAALVAATAVALRAAIAERRGSTWSAAVLSRRGLRPSRPAPCALLSSPGWLAPRLAETGLQVRPDLVWSVWVGAAALVAAFGLIAAGAGAAIVLTGAAVAGPCVARRMFRHRGGALLEAALPGAVEAMAAGLRSGASLRQAVGEAARATPGPLGADLTQVAVAASRGAGMVTALEGWAARRPLPGVRLVVSALCLGAETGGLAAQAVDAVALTLRQRLGAQAEAKALATQARLSAAVIAVAPVAFCLLAGAADSRSLVFLLKTPTGLLLLSTGLCLDVLGALWMARLTRIEQ